MKRLLLPCFPLLLAAACATARGPMAMATFRPAAGTAVGGVVHFQELGGGGVEVQVDLTGVPPGEHGFHIHAGSDCGDTGPHFNPINMPHAAPDAVSHHAGDFGNITAGPDGEVHTRFTTRSITVSEGPTSITGRTVVLHARRDDLTSQPSGNSGEAIACGQIAPMAGSMH